ncbi:MAG: hypothetical protein QOE61_4426 [Micromonosporaceae bacterium]|nr:hypothetical protein [Micromonosporaceae bacterium]
MTYRYRFISEHRASYCVKRLCRVLAVRRQGFYEWLDAPRPASSVRRTRANSTFSMRSKPNSTGT